MDVSRKIGTGFITAGVNRRQGRRDGRPAPPRQQMKKA
jgi:hypothetical protein